MYVNQEGNLLELMDFVLTLQIIFFHTMMHAKQQRQQFTNTRRILVIGMLH